MKNFLIGLFTGLLVCFLGLVIIFFALVRIAGSFGQQKQSIAADSTLILKLEGDVPEKSAPEIPIPLFQQQVPITVQQSWEIFHRAAADSRIKAIVFEPNNLSVGWAKLEEIRQQVLDFRKSGKPIVAFLRGAGSREYYVATAADRIYMMPDDVLDVKGLRVESMFFKNTLDKIGVDMDVIHAGKYKDAGDIFTRTSMSPETREVLNDVLDHYYGNLVNVIAEGRKKTPDEIRALIDQGPFQGTQAKTNGLVDVTGYEDQVAQELQKRLNQQKLTEVSVKNYLAAIAGSPGGGQKVALLVGDGEITRGGDTGSLQEESGIRSKSFIRLLQQVKNDSTIKAVILRINSPGGDAVASDEILQVAKDLSRAKPMVISMSDYAASGGYFIAMTGAPIIAYPNTLTGSIGVIMAKPNLHGLYDKVGITKDLLARGQNSTLDSDYFPLTDSERQKLMSQVDEVYRGFVSRVAAGRKRPYEQIDAIAQGRVWLGEEGKQNGLVDELGGLDRAIEVVKQKAGIGASEQITLVSYPPRRSILDVMTSRPEDNPSIRALAFRHLVRDVPVQSLLSGGLLELMPYAIRVK